jgi:ketosteroid isomerase-like protein
MVSEIPGIVSTYLQIAGSVDRADADRIAACFTDDAELTDEGQTRRGRVAIREWWQGPATTYDYTVQVRGGRAVDSDRYVVFTRLTGNFPGGTADLADRFTLRDGRIAQLDIAPPLPGEGPDDSAAG